MNHEGHEEIEEREHGAVDRRRGGLHSQAAVDGLRDLRDFYFVIFVVERSS